MSDAIYDRFECVDDLMKYGLARRGSLAIGVDNIDRE